MRYTLGEIARLLDGELIGDPQSVITGISGIKEAKEGDITFLANPKYCCLMQSTKAAAVITARDAGNFDKPVIKTDNPSVAFAKVVSLVAGSGIRHPQGVHPTAIISPKAKVDQSVTIGAYSVIEEEAVIGANTIIYSGCYIGHNAKIGGDCLVYPHVTVRERVEIGERVIIHSGAVIGSDGFGFAMIKGVQEKIPQIGTVLIEDDVEIGANVTIDRARFDKTVIGRGTKIDNLVQIAHNVITGNNCIIVAQAGVSGSTVLGEGVILAGQAGIVGHIRIGDRSLVHAQAGVTKSVPENTRVSGYPARPHAEAKRVNACIQRLPELYRKIKELEAKICELNEKTDESKWITKKP